jgi:hypothetical protein
MDDEVGLKTLEKAIALDQSISQGLTEALE